MWLRATRAFAELGMVPQHRRAGLRWVAPAELGAKAPSLNLLLTARLKPCPPDPRAPDPCLLLHRLKPFSLSVELQVLRLRCYFGQRNGVSAQDDTVKNICMS